MNAIQARSSAGASFRFLRVPGIGCVVNELIVSSTNGAKERYCKKCGNGLGKLSKPRAAYVEREQAPEGQPGA